MLINILNLPQNTKYSDVKALVRATCGVEDMIMDHMIMHTARSKQVTLGLANEEDAAILVKKLNGFYMDGYRLQVVPKSKVPSTPQPDIPPLIPVWSANQAPPMVPPPPLMNFGTNVNQTVPYYQLNQPSYDSQSGPSTSNAQIMTYPFGNTNNNVNRQVSWSGQNNQPSITSTWDQRESKWEDNRESRRESNRGWGNSQMEWESNNTSQYDNSRDSRISSKRGSEWGDNRGSRRDDYRTNKKDRDSRWDSSRDSRWNDDRDSNRNSYRSNQSGASPRGRDSSYNRYDQSQSRSSPGRGYSSYDSSNTRNDYRDQYQNSKRNRSPVDRRADRAPSPHAKRARTNNLPQNEPSRRNLTPSELGAMQKAYNNVHQQQEPNQYPGQKKDRSVIMNWQSQLASKFAKNILENKSYEYIGVSPAKLHHELKQALRARLETCFKFKVYSMKEMEEMYKMKHTPTTDWVILRDTLVKLGGTLISPVPRAKKPKGKKNARQLPVAPQYGAVFGNLKVDHRNEPKGPPQQPQGGGVTNQGNAPKRSVASSFWTDATIQQPQGIGNQNQGNQNVPQQHPQAKKNPGSIPLAQIPGRIPQYPNGDKQQYREQKQNMAALYTSDEYVEGIMENLKPAVKQAMLEEMNKLAEVVVDTCKNPEPAEEVFCKRLVNSVPDEMKKMMKINMTRRLVPILPIGVRIFSSPPVKRIPLENFLKEYKTTVLKKSKLKNYFIAYCQSFEEHDKLCATKTTIDRSYVTFKSLHMAGIKEKTTKGAILKQRKQLKREHIQHSKMMLGLTDEPTAPTEVKGETVDEKELCQEMKQLYDEINAPVDEGNAPIDETSGQNAETAVSENKGETNNFEAHVKSIATLDFTSDDIIENFVNTNQACLPIEDKIGDEIRKDDDDVQEHVKEIETVNLVDDNDDDVKPVGDADPDADDVDWANVNDDDLEDW